MNGTQSLRLNERHSYSENDKFLRCFSWVRGVTKNDWWHDAVVTCVWFQVVGSMYHLSPMKTPWHGYQIVANSQVSQSVKLHSKCSKPYQVLSQRVDKYCCKRFFLC